MLISKILSRTTRTYSANNYQKSIIRQITGQHESKDITHEAVTPTPLQSVKSRAAGSARQHFIDWTRVLCQGGSGGDGCIAMMHLFANPNAGPSGGDGGNGGHIIFQASHNVKSLANVQSTYRGACGEHGMGDHMHGKNAEHTFVSVPIGTVVKDLKTGKQVADLDVQGSMFIAARAGAGGRGNAFYLSNTNRHPRICEKGAKGETHKWILEMKVLAHAGLIGFPNVGKSTFLRAISRARPEVANYPFTTLNPHVGIVQYDDYTQLAIADLPGLIPDSHKNRGLGIDFLKHIERCLCLIYVIDISQTDPLPIQQFDTLRYELEQYQRGLSSRPQVILCNKIDVDGSRELFEDFRKVLEEREEGFTLVPLSAKRGTNVTTILKYVRALYDEYHRKMADDPERFEW